MPNPELSPNQYIAIASLASGATIGQAAKAAKVSEKTIDNWLRIPEVKTELRSQVKNLYQSQLLTCQRLLNKALARLEEILEDCDAKPADIIKITQLLLSAADRFTNLDLEDRLAALEAAISD